MTVTQDERAQSGPGAFRDDVGVLLLDESLLLAARISRAPAHGSAEMAAVAVAAGDQIVELVEDADGGVAAWERATAGPLTLSTEEPLERWTLLLEAPGTRVEAELTALTAPAALAEPATAAVGRAAGVRRYAQLCRARGSADVPGHSGTIDALAVRTHRWGTATETPRARFLTAASADGTLLTVATARPPGSEAHGDELVGAHTARAEHGGAIVSPFETVRLSTVLGEDGLPVTAGAELFRPGDEVPSRLAGTAAGGISVASAGGRSSVTLFRFSLDGVPALGAYEIESHP